jgi:epidermal growth factor receptor substrate 15
MFGPKERSPSVSGGHSPAPPQVPSFFNRPTPTFVPQSSFGQSILPTSTGGSNHSGRGPFAQPPKPDMDDLLGDADPEVSKKVTNESMELANLSNQIGSLTKQTQELNIKRVSAESDLSNLTSQKQNIEAQLAQLRAAYEKEAATVNRVEEQLAVSRQDTAKVTQEYHQLDAEYNQLQYKIQELSSQLEADKRENENLKERMNAINAENRQLREELERLQMQTRRERGMVAINKKQVEKSEQERDKLKSQIEEASRPQPSTPHPPSSPTLSQSSVTGSHNPFHARKSPPIPENVGYTPSPFGPIKPSMDDVFGPAFTSSTPPPQTSFTSRNAADSSIYTPSGTESGHGGRSTPTTSAPSSSYHGSPPPSEAPPPAVDAQMTSAFLPLPGINRTDSVTSSVQVNPSASVRTADHSRPETPTNVFGAAAVETPGRNQREDRTGSFSVKSDAGIEASGRPAFPPFDRRIDSPFSQVEKNNTGGTSGGDETRKLEKSDSYYGSAVPGSFPSVEPSNPIKATPTGESTMSNQSRRSNLSRSAFGDPFSINKEDTRASSRQDFDDAFSKYAAVEHHTGGSGSISASKFHDEFPPIQEVRPDSDSESEVDVGFDDNFTTASPAQTKANPGSAAPTNVAESSSAPPPALAQSSPPPYGTEKPYEFGGLLPSRSDPMKHDAPTPGGSTNAVVFPSATKDEFDDDAFGDLAEAKEADDKSADNEFGTAASAFDDDFNPVFDSRTTTSAGLDGDFDQFTFNVGEQGKQASPQDWDAIFANFGEQQQPSEQQQGKENLPTNAGGATDQSGTDPGEGGVSLSSSDHPIPPPSNTVVPEGGVKTVGGNDEKVEKLTGMGFDRESSVNALQKNGWDIDRVSSFSLI